MNSIKQRFEFLKDDIDFPFYNDVPKLSTSDWLLMLCSIALVVALIAVKSLSGGYLPILLFIVTVVPALYLCRGNLKIFFKKPKLRDFLTIALCLVGYYIWSVLMVCLLVFVLQVPISANVILETFKNPTLITFIMPLFQLLGEEFFKIFTLLIVMHIVFKHTENRNLAIGLGIIVSITAFGLLHINAYSNKILQIMLIQGLGSIFALYPYLKTKNVVNSYILHLIVDYSPFTIIMLGSL